MVALALLPRAIFGLLLLAVVLLALLLGRLPSPGPDCRPGVSLPACQLQASSRL